MIRRSHALFCLALFLMPVFVLAHSPEQKLQKREAELARRTRQSNGIVVGAPKFYDDSLLQQMLNAAQAQLAALKVLDQGGITSRIGAVTGATQQFSGFALNLQGAPAPSVVTTSKGPTTNISQAPAGTTTITNAPTEDVLTTAPQFNATIPTAPAPSTTLPSSPSISASGALNEQLQLTYEIASLRLLLEGALSDRIVKTISGQQIVKPRVTLGFPIDVTPDARFKNAVAVVEVEVEAESTRDFSPDGQRPAITALLPREKTYNVAAITDRSTSIGAGLVTQIASIGGSFLSGRKTYYIVQDQDTLALMIQPEAALTNPRLAGFGWQFRPVLGQSFVRGGLRKTFVQLAFPSQLQPPSFGKVRIRSYWRRYDRKTGVLKGVVRGSLRDDYPEFTIDSFHMKQSVAAFNVQETEDLGGGQMLVRIPGSFLGGTYVRVGTSILQPGSNGFTSEAGLIRFVAPISDLATKRVVVVSRDGTEVPLRIAKTFTCNRLTIKQDGLSITPIDETNSILRIELEAHDVPELVPLVLVIGGKVFGYSDAPIGRSGHTLSAVLPTAFLAANRNVIVKPLFVDDDFSARGSLLTPRSTVERLALVNQSSTLTYLLYGSRLTNVSVLLPASATFKALGSGEDSDSVRLLELPADDAKTLKHLIFQRTGERPFTVALPPLTPEPPKPAPKFRERVTVGADDAVILGEGLTDVVKITALKQELSNLERSADGKSIKVKGLVSAGVTAAARIIDFEVTRTAGKSTIQLEVVNSKIELLQ